MVSRLPSTFAWIRAALAGALLLLAPAPGRAQREPLEQELRKQSTAELARLARDLGDAKRGAIVFHQPYLACTRCHAGDQKTLVGPDLAQLGKEGTPLHLVESLLEPSKAIRQGYESTILLLENGQTIAGRLIEETGEALVLVEPESTGPPRRVARSRVEERQKGDRSLMPEGLMNLLSSRQQFYDLVAYLVEIAEQGPARASELAPNPALYAAFFLPEYEARVDHVGLIGDWNAESLARGQAIYERVCANCHGTRDRPGSLPTAPRFDNGKFKNGGDPYGMYQTLTRGFGLMAPQTWMVPRQKYDVIHYVREEYLKRDNPEWYAPIDPAYLAALPKGNTKGPAPTALEPWLAMDYGPTLIHTYEAGHGGTNIAQKGIAIRLDSGPGGITRGEHWLIFEHDTLRVAAAWSRAGQSTPFIDWNGVQFNGRHEVHPRIAGTLAFVNATGPGWANPLDGGFEELRVRGRDGKPYGPMPRDWGRFRGLYHHGQRVVLSYSVGDTEVLESPGLASPENESPAPNQSPARATPPQRVAGHSAAPATPVFTRTFNIGPRRRDMRLRVAEHPTARSIRRVTRLVDQGLVAITGDAGSPAGAVQDNGGRFGDERLLTLWAGIAPAAPDLKWIVDGPALQLAIPAGDKALAFTLWIDARPEPDQAALAPRVVIDQPARDLALVTKGGPPRWPETLAAPAVLGNDQGPFAVDVLVHPANNPWLAQMRFTGIDFFPDGRAAVVCTWDGDVWLIDGLEALDRPAAGKPEVPLIWRRIASGMFQPLGIKIIQDRIFVTCRDQIVILRDLNGDGETDFYQNFNSDHQVTEHFHEFAMGLQTDQEGNLYYTKSARHALPAVVPQHGTLLKVSADGERTEILATGFRAANGVCLNPDGTFIVTDQEGHWIPKNRINRVRPGGFYGNMLAYHDVTDSSDGAMEQPICWITNAFDRSPAELLWVESDAWGPLKGSLLNLSYGYGKVYVVPHEEVAGRFQGGMCELPLPLLPTGVMRGRFNPRDGQLYACGMYAWAGSATQPGGLYRIRYTGKPVYVPLALQARAGQIALMFSGPLHPATVDDLARFRIKSWSLKRTANYGSEHHGEQTLRVAGARLDALGTTLTLDVPDLRPTWCMEIAYQITTDRGTTLRGRVHNTIHALDETR